MFLIRTDVATSRFVKIWHITIIRDASTRAITVVGHRMDRFKLCFLPYMRVRHSCGFGDLVIERLLHELQLLPPAVFRGAMKTTFCIVPHHRYDELIRQAAPSPDEGFRPFLNVRWDHLLNKGEVKYS